MGRVSNGRRARTCIGRKLRAAWQSHRVVAHGRRIAALTVVGVLVLSGVAGALLPMLPAGASPPSTPAITTRYQVIDDMLTMQQRIDQLERDLSDARNEISVLQLLRAHDIQLHDRTRAEDLKRVTSLEWNVDQLWTGCR